MTRHIESPRTCRAELRRKLAGLVSRIDLMTYEAQRSEGVRRDALLEDIAGLHRQAGGLRDELLERSAAILEADLAAPAPHPLEAPARLEDAIAWGLA